MAISELNIKSEDRELLKNIQSGNKTAIIQGLVHPGAIYRVNAAINAVRYEIREATIKIYLDRLKTDEIVMNGYKVSDFAYAALDLLNLERYTQNDIRVRRLIVSKFNFE